MNLKIALEDVDSGANVVGSDGLFKSRPFTINIVEAITTEELRTPMITKCFLGIALSLVNMLLPALKRPCFIDFNLLFWY